MRRPEEVPRFPGGRIRVAGFATVDLLLALVILSVIAALARPALHEARLESRVAQAVADLHLVREAASSYQNAQGEWPPDGSRGRIPPGLEEYLPAGFDFRKPEYVLDYDSWMVESRAPFRIGITIAIEDPELGRAVLDLLGNEVWTDGQGEFTWIVEG